VRENFIFEAESLNTYVTAEKADRADAAEKADRVERADAADRVERADRADAAGVYVWCLLKSIHYRLWLWISCG
jgi:hypothetical protein